MATLLLATGNGAANSATFTLAAGESATLALREYALLGGESVPTPCFIEMQDDAAAWYQVGVLQPGAAQVLQATGTFRLRRPSGVRWGAFRG